MPLQNIQLHQNTTNRKCSRASLPCVSVCVCMWSRTSLTGDTEPTMLGETHTPGATQPGRHGEKYSNLAQGTKRGPGWIIDRYHRLILAHFCWGWGGGLTCNYATIIQRPMKGMQLVGHLVSYSTHCPSKVSYHDVMEQLYTVSRRGSSHTVGITGI